MKINNTTTLRYNMGKRLHRVRVDLDDVMMIGIGDTNEIYDNLDIMF